MWKHAHLSIVISNRANKTTKEDFDATFVQGNVATTKPVSQPPFSSNVVKGLMKICGYTKGINLNFEIT